MYSDSAAKMARLQDAAMNAALASTCCESKTEPLTVKCHQILDGACSIRSLSETIRGKLYGSVPQAPENNQREPYSIEDILNIADEILRQAHKTLCEISERT